MEGIAVREKFKARRCILYIMNVKLIILMIFDSSAIEFDLHLYLHLYLRNEKNEGDFLAVSLSFHLIFFPFFLSSSLNTPNLHIVTINRVFIHPSVFDDWVCICILYAFAFAFAIASTGSGYLPSIPFHSLPMAFCWRSIPLTLTSVA